MPSPWLFSFDLILVTTWVGAWVFKNEGKSRTTWKNRLVDPSPNDHKSTGFTKTLPMEIMALAIPIIHKQCQLTSHCCLLHHCI